MKKTLRQLIAAAALFLPLVGAHASEGEIKLEKAPIDIQDTESLQRGAQLFVNYCLSCHSANAMRFNRLMDIGLSEQQIKDFILPPGAKVGDPMRISMQTPDAKVWLGNTPPDLSVIARSRGADYLYAYMRSFYRDDSRPTGWNNLVFDKVAMPHVFWEWQGEQVLKVHKGANGHEEKSLELVKAGSMTKLENGKAITLDYDRRMADLVNYMVYMAEPAQVRRHQIGYLVLMFLGLVLLPLSYFLKKEYWKDVH